MKQLTTTLFVLLIALTIYAQETRFGVKGGLNLATLNSQELETHSDFRLNLKSKTGFHIGAFVEIGISESMSIQPELLYSTQGAKFTTTNTSGTIFYDFINIPILLKYYVTDGLGLEAGPQIGYALTGKFKQEGSSSSYEVDFINQVNRLSLGLNIGASYNITDNLIVGMRYNAGLNNLNNDKDESYSYSYSSGSGGSSNYRFFPKNFTIKSNTFQVSVGYRF